MDKHQLKGQAKDVSGRLERQAGEWTGDEEKQARGAAKQVEGKIQNVLGKAKNKAKKEKQRIEKRAANERTDRAA